ncbi:MAG: ice-binding family protein [Acidimicrobiia bacterium]|nr:ice-binding family protein [Acidimicrobiia bacterium]
MRQHPPAYSARNVSITVLVSLLVFFAAGPALGGALESQVGLGTADDFAVLAGETITNTGPTTITGDVGLDPGTATPGFGSVTLNGDLHVDDVVAEQAKVDLITAYNDAAGRGPATTVATELGGQTLIGGVYDSEAGTFGITGTLTLDAQDDPNAVFIFQMESTLITESASSVNLIRGAQACNVFWQVGISATLKTNSTFRGTILALTSITLETGATIEGRALARNGSVTMDTNTITRAVCSSPTTTPTTTTTSTPGGTTTSTLAPPTGGVGTGGGSTSGAQNMILLLGGFSLLALAVGAFEVRRRLNRRSG